MKIAMYGGSFNPPHFGHLDVVLDSVNNYDDDEIHVVPCFKQTGKDLADFAHRYNMCKLMFSDIPKVKVSTVERRLGGESLTINTVKYLKVVYGTFDRIVPEIVLIVGSDTASKIPTWEGGEELLKHVTLRIAPRTNVSSTELREIVSKGERRLSKTKESVSDYIFNNFLYRENF